MKYAGMVVWMLPSAPVFKRKPTVQPSMRNSRWTFLTIRYARTLITIASRVMTNGIKKYRIPRISPVNRKRISRMSGR